DREVARAQIVLDRRAERREVDRPAAVERNAPGAVARAERKRRAARPPCVRARRPLRGAARDVDVEHLAAEQPVAHGAAYHPGLRAGEQLPGELIHTRASAAPAPGLR